MLKKIITAFALLLAALVPGAAGARFNAEQVFLPVIASAPASPNLGGCPILPADSIWNRPVDDLPVHPNSAQYVNSVGSAGTVHPDFGSGLWEGFPIGIPFIIVPSTQPPVAITFEYDDESDPGPYPIPANPPVEGDPNGGGDRHILILQQGSCKLFEVFAAEKQANGSWQAGSGAVFDLRSNALRPAGWTSADAAGLPILPGLVRYDEVASGDIRHAIRFTAPRSPQGVYVWPARHWACSGSQCSASAPPFGTRFRLRADYPTESLSHQARVIAQAMQIYGIILADNGAPWYLSGAPDERWDNDDLRDLRQITGADFEAVDTSGLLIDPNSGAAKQK